MLSQCQLDSNNRHSNPISMFDAIICAGKENIDVWQIDVYFFLITTSRQLLLFNLPFVYNQISEEVVFDVKHSCYVKILYREYWL